MRTEYEVVVAKDGKVIVYVIEYTKKKAKSQLNKFRRAFPDCDVQVFIREDEEAA